MTDPMTGPDAVTRQMPEGYRSASERLADAWEHRVHGWEWQDVEDLAYQVFYKDTSELSNDEQSRLLLIMVEVGLIDGAALSAGEGTEGEG